jgi:hypothetical protein
LRDEEAVLRALQSEAALTRAEAELYLRLLREGAVAASEKTAEVQTLLDKGMAILSGDDKRFIPVHPRLAVANHYRTWRERMVREINDRRMRTDRLILELIPVYEATMEKRLAAKGQARKR